MTGRTPKVREGHDNKFHKKEKFVYVKVDERDQEYNIGHEEVKENNMNVAKLKPGSPYVCKLLKPSDRKNPVELKNEKKFAKMYPFDITKCNEIFDLVVVEWTNHSI